MKIISRQLCLHPHQMYDITTSSGLMTKCMNDAHTEAIKQILIGFYRDSS